MPIKLWLYAPVSCARCGVFLIGERRGESQDVRVVVHAPTGCDLDGEEFEAPSIELKRVS